MTRVDVDALAERVDLWRKIAIAASGKIPNYPLEQFREERRKAAAGVLSIALRCEVQPGDHRYVDWLIGMDEDALAIVCALVDLSRPLARAREIL